MAIPIGSRGEAAAVVSPENTALAAGSGSLPVYATPCMAALMEQAACAALAPCLDASHSSVGTRLQISHESATPEGMAVRAEAEVTAVDGRRVLFRVAAYDEAGLIGQGEHERCIIRTEPFLQRALAKRSAP